MKIARNGERHLFSCKGDCLVYTPFSMGNVPIFCHFLLPFLTGITK
jgi:hypothetical protein